MSGRAAGALAVLGWPSRSLEVCAEMSLPGFLYVQMDIWGVNRSLVREACESSARTSRGEPLLERDLVFEENATLAVARASHFVVQSERMAQRVRELSGVHRPTIVLGRGVDLPARLPGRLERRRRFMPVFWHAAFPAAVATLPYVAECTIVASSGNLYSLELSTWHQKRATST